MNIHLQNYLINKFPDLYTDSNNPEQFSSVGFQCGDGWFRLMLWVSRYLQGYSIIQNEYAKKFPDVYRPVDKIKIKEVKKEFAILKIVITGGNEHINSILGFVSYISGFICEESGTVDNVGVNKKGVLKTHNIKYSNPDDFYPVDDSELISIIRDLKSNKQLEFNWFE